MKIDLLYTLHNREEDKTWHELLESQRRTAILADEYGFDALWMGEHHFHALGGDVDPNPLMLMSDLAARTSRITFGTAAIIAPLWHPIRLAEDIAMLDHITDGRLRVGFARGILPMEVLNLNPEADRWRASDASRAIFKENLDIMRTAWTEKDFSWKSERYTFPVPGIEGTPIHGDPGLKTASSDRPFLPARWLDDDGKMVKMSIEPRPLQNPHPALHSVTDSEQGFLDAARYGLQPISWFPTGQVLDNLFDAYRNEVAATTGQPPLPLGAGCSVLRIAFVAPTDEEARRITEPTINIIFNSINRVRGLTYWLDADEDPNDPKFADVNPYDFLMERNHLMIGSPESVTERLLNFDATHHIDRMLLQFSIGVITDEEAESAMKLFATEVMPALNTTKNQTTHSALVQ